MAGFGGFGFRGRCVGRDARLLFCLVGVWTVLRGGLVTAQEAPPPQNEAIHTLHVYANLVQVPTLVLGPHLEQVKTVPESRFSVSIDSGPWFRATHVRLEGDDPISLSILLDAGGDAAELMPKIDDAIAGLAPLSLHPVDRVSIFAMDCSLVRSWDDLPAEKAGLKTAVNHALQSWRDRSGSKHRPACQQPVHLWDALGFIVGELYKVPGRRVVLVVSDGRDKGSKRTWNEVKTYAQATAVTVFGVTYFPQYAASNYGRGGIRKMSSEDPFQMVCQLSGGVVLSTSNAWLEDTLRRFMAMVRGRYIVEFPRPFNSSAGEHTMQVRVEKSGSDVIRSTGIAVPIPDAALLADPTTVRSDPSLAPQEGSRHPLKTP